MRGSVSSRLIIGRAEGRMPQSMSRDLSSQPVSVGMLPEYSNQAVKPVV